MMSYYVQTNNEAARYRAELSRQEAEEFVERELKCPKCGYLVATAFSDASRTLQDQVSEVQDYIGFEFCVLLQTQIQT